jgi:hypothetical protein
MPELTSEERRKGLEFANELTLLAAERAPNVRLEKIVQRIAQQIRQICGFSPALKMAEIVRLAKVTNGGGGISHAELIELTGWHKDEIYELVKELEKESLPRIRVEGIKPAGSKGGRPAVLIFAIANAKRDEAVLNISVVKS